MALTSTDRKEIESMIKKEIKDFFDSNSSKQFEKKLLDKVSYELTEGKRGPSATDVKKI